MDNSARETLLRHLTGASAAPQQSLSGTSPAPEPAHFHWVETTNPAAMKPKPTTMFQFPRASTGIEPSVT